ncbi:CREB-binding protein [Anoplophora glabripennis]|uniref:CREB-binding protein n=1 Tax=Anoplophora glabripennis TaxID=217634 RepID=UPI0008750865|nr:CREB-binding protein [Anoplophora glabripennis]
MENFSCDIKSLPPQINANTASLYRPQPPHDPPPVPPAAVPHPDADFLRPATDPRLNPRMQYDSQQVAPYVPQVPVQPQSGWIPHQSNQMPPPVPQYAVSDKNSHIFNHKESGLQVPDGQEISQMQYTESMSGRDYPKVPNYYPDNNYRQPIQQENWPSADETRYDPQKYPQDPLQLQSEQAMKDQTNYKAPPVQHSNTLKSDAVNPKHVQEKLAHDLKHSKENMIHGVVNREKIKIGNHMHHEEYADVVAYKVSDSNDLQDGISQTPRGAVLSVTLGLIITFIMAIMIGCRLKMVRRRVRRGKSYAHDADYLVNGMYL